MFASMDDGFGAYTQERRWTADPTHIKSILKSRRLAPGQPFPWRNTMPDRQDGPMAACTRTWCATRLEAPSVQCLANGGYGAAEDASLTSSSTRFAEKPAVARLPRTMTGRVTKVYSCAI